MCVARSKMHSGTFTDHWIRAFRFLSKPSDSKQQFHFWGNTWEVTRLDLPDEKLTRFSPYCRCAAVFKVNAWLQNYWMTCGSACLCMFHMFGCVFMSFWISFRVKVWEKAVKSGGWWDFRSRGCAVRSWKGSSLLAVWCSSMENQAIGTCLLLCLSLTFGEKSEAVTRSLRGTLNSGRWHLEISGAAAGSTLTDSNRWSKLESNWN